MKLRAKLVRVVALVADDVGPAKAREQERRDRYLVALTFGDCEADRPSDSIDDGVDLRGRTSARTPDLLRPPFRAPCAS